MPGLKELLIKANHEPVIPFLAIIRVRRVAWIIPRRIRGNGAPRVLSASATAVPIRLNVGIVLRSAGDQCVGGQQCDCEEGPRDHDMTPSIPIFGIANDRWRQGRDNEHGRFLITTFCESRRTESVLRVRSTG